MNRINLAIVILLAIFVATIIITRPESKPDTSQRPEKKEQSR